MDGEPSLIGQEFGGGREEGRSTMGETQTFRRNKDISRVLSRTSSDSRQAFCYLTLLRTAGKVYRGIWQAGPSRPFGAREGPCVVINEINLGDASRPRL
jgi:hypothetical protein